jgi:hypothetical protein
VNHGDELRRCLPEPRFAANGSAVVAIGLVYAFFGSNGKIGTTVLSSSSPGG